MLATWDPFSELTRLSDEVSRRFASDRMAPFKPAVDIHEDPESFTFSAELPGLRPEDVHVHVERNVMTIEGERKLEKEETKDGYRRIERSYGHFQRSFSLPETADSENIFAEMKEGVLTLRVPKRATEAKRTVAIKG